MVFNELAPPYDFRMKFRIEINAVMQRVIQSIAFALSFIYSTNFKTSVRTDLGLCLPFQSSLTISFFGCRRLSYDSLILWKRRRLISLIIPLVSGLNYVLCY